jgi:hypothetical protein
MKDSNTSFMSIRRAEARIPPLFGKELLGDVGEDGVLPDHANPFLVEARVEEVAGPDRRMAIAELLVGTVDHIGHPLHVRSVALEPSAQESLDRRLVGEEGNEMKPPPQCQIDQGDRAVGRVHGADHPEIPGQCEALFRILESDLVRAVFQEEVELTEDLRKVAAQGPRFQIGNNRGGINGWIGSNSIYGRLLREE